MEAYDTLWGYHAADQWLEDSMGLSRNPYGILFSLRSGFTAYNVISPVSHVLLPPSTPTSGRQDHTSLPYALMPFVFGTTSVHRNPSLVGNDGRRPSERDGMVIRIHLICISGKAKCF